jgi:hypothetical protein
MSRATGSPKRVSTVGATSRTEAAPRVIPGRMSGPARRSIPSGVCQSAAFPCSMVESLLGGRLVSDLKPWSEATTMSASSPAAATISPMKRSCRS